MDDKQKSKRGREEVEEEEEDDDEAETGEGPEKKKGKEKVAVDEGTFILFPPLVHLRSSIDVNAFAQMLTDAMEEDSDDETPITNGEPA